MPLNDLVKDYSITTISQKTNIPVEILDKLINKEWQSLQLAKSKGFIAIIEREFNIDLSDLKDEATEYYASHKKEDVFRPIDLVDAQSVGGGAGKIVTNIVALLTIALVAYAGWFYFVKPKNSMMTQADSNSSNGLIKESINIAKNLVGIQDKPKESNVSTLKEKKEAIKVVEEKNITSTPAPTVEPKVEEKKIEEKRKFDITTDIKESNDTNDSSVVVEKLAPTTNTDSKENANESLIEENSSSIKQDVETLLEENSTIKEESLQEQNSTIENNKTVDVNITLASSELNSTEDNQAVASSSVTIKPSVKAIWVGVYNLESGKRVAKVVNGSFDFSTDGSDLAIVTGHSKFEVSTDNGLVKKFDGKGKKYLYISKSEIKELTKLEYKALTKNRAW